MSEKLTPRKVKKTIRQLGRTPDGVAQALRAQGILGWRGDAQHCPVANYLRQRFENYGYVGVGRHGATGSHVSVENTKAVREFIFRFDRGDYPNNIGAEHRKLWQ